MIKNDCKVKIERGNDKPSSRWNEGIQFIEKQCGKEGKKGWTIPFPVKIISKLKNACTIPIGVEVNSLLMIMEKQ